MTKSNHTTLKNLGISVTLSLLVLLLGAMVFTGMVNAQGPVLDDTPYELGADVTADLVVGQEVTGGELSVSFAVEAAAASECDDKPLILDSRPDGHNSFSVLPKLAEDEFDRAQAFFKFQVRDEYGCRRATPGQKYWDAKYLFLECGATNIQPQVYDINGQKITDRGILLFLHWPGTEQFPAQVDPPYAQTGVAGFTENGDIGWAYGGQSHIGEDGGPYLTWASSDPAGWTDRIVGSDAIDKIGWWDDHCEFSPMWYETRKEGGGVDPVDGLALVDVDENGNETGYIKFQTGDLPVGERLLKLQDESGDLGYVPWMH